MALNLNNGKTQIQLYLTYNFSFQIIANRYTFNEDTIIGSGSFGNCYKSIDTKTNEAVVLKIIPIQSNTIDQFSEEASLLETLQHPHLCQGIEHFIINNQHEKVEQQIDQSSLNESYQFVIVMKYYPNQDIAQYLSNHQVTEELKLQWVIQISDAVAYLHSKNLVHRDLKLQNVFLSEDLQCYLGDFGTIKQLERGKMAQTQIFTFQTCSPEQLDNKPYDYRTDLFSLGCLIYEIFEGKSPFCHDGNIAEAVERISKVQYDECKCGNKKIITVIHNLLQLDPEKRWNASKNNQSEDSQSEIQSKDSEEINQIDQLDQEKLLVDQNEFKKAIKQKLNQIFKNQKKLQKFINFVQKLHSRKYNDIDDIQEIQNDIQQLRKQDINLQQRYQLIQQIKEKYLQKQNFDQKNIQNIVFFVDFILYE